MRCQMAYKRVASRVGHVAASYSSALQQPSLIYVSLGTNHSQKYKRYFGTCFTIHSLICHLKTLREQQLDTLSLLN